jgi:hypothetical protein
MNRLFVTTALALVAVCGGCTTTSTNNFDKTITTLHDDGCHATVNLSAQAGAVNPGSGFQFQGTIDCPAASSPAAAKLVKPADSSAEHPAPAPTFLQ